MNNYKLIMLDTPIIVSDEEIKDGDFCYDLFNNKIYPATKVVEHNKKQLDFPIYKMITGLSILPSIDWNGLESEFGHVDVHKYLKIILGEEYFSRINKDGSQFALLTKTFKTAQQLNDKKFSENDLKKAMLIMYDECAKKRISDVFYDGIINNTIKELQQPKTFDIQIETEYLHDDSVPYPKTKGTIPKIINNKVKILKKL